jgi:hypothetical protein
MFARATCHSNEGQRCQLQTPMPHEPEAQSVPLRHGAPDPIFAHVPEHEPDAHCEPDEQELPGASRHWPLGVVVLQMLLPEHAPALPHPQLPSEKHSGAVPKGHAMQVAPFSPQPVFGSCPSAQVPFMQHPRLQ